MPSRFTRETLINCLCGRIAIAEMQRGARNLNIFLYMPRFPRSVRMSANRQILRSIYYFAAQTINQHFPRQPTKTPNSVLRPLDEMLIYLYANSSFVSAASLDFGVFGGCHYYGQRVAGRAFRFYGLCSTSHVTVCQSRDAILSLLIIRVGSINNISRPFAMHSTF